MGKLVIKKGDITLEETDAIVNAANESLLGGGGVDGAIHRAAGPSVLKECRLIGGCLTGEAVITRAGALKAKYIIHAVGPIWRQGRAREEYFLEHCYTHSFNIAIKHHCASISFPAISTGAYLFPLPRATEIALKTGMNFKDRFDEIRYICFSDKDYEVYRAKYRALNIRR